MSFQLHTFGLVAFALLYLCYNAHGCKSGPSNKAKYIGCYQDNKGNRDLPYQVSGSGQMGKAICEQRCRTMGSKYFGLQGGDECWCGDSYGKFGMTEDGSCNRNCNGQPEEICGGVVLNSVYEITY